MCYPADAMLILIAMGRIGTELRTEANGAFTLVCGPMVPSTVLCIDRCLVKIC